MAGEIKLNNVSIATENAGTVTINNATLGNSMVLGTTASPIANNLVFANGNGIDFSAAAGSAAGSSSAVLDDYEEGTWTPTLSSSGTEPTVSSYQGRSGRYTKLGDTVNVTCYIRATLSATGSGYPKITGLPFTAYTYPGVSLGIANLLNNEHDSDNYAQNSEVILQQASYTTAANTYITFQLTFQQN